MLFFDSLCLGAVFVFGCVGFIPPLGSQNDGYRISVTIHSPKDCNKLTDLVVVHCRILGLNEGMVSCAVQDERVGWARHLSRACVLFGFWSLSVEDANTTIWI